MCSMNRRWLWLSVVTNSFLASTWAESVQFYYNLQKDTCTWGDQSFEATNNTANGGLCAYIKSVDRVYACPAPDSACWNWFQDCANGDGPGPDQIQCNRGGTVWCCSNLETCTVTKDQINVCISQFSNPNSGITPREAQAVEFSAIPSSLIPTTSVQATPSSFVTSATFAAANVGVTSSTKSSSSSSLSSFLSSSSSSSTASITTSGPTLLANAARPQHSAIGAIIGIIVGALALIAVIVAGIIWLVRRRRRTVTAQHQHQQRQQQTQSLMGHSSSRYETPTLGPAPQPAGYDTGLTTGYSFYEKSSTEIVEAPGPGTWPVQMPSSSGAPLYPNPHSHSRVELE